MTQRIISQKRIKELLDYDDLTGVLRWKNRERKHFKNNQVFYAWNTRNSGNVAGTIDKNGYIYIRINGKGYFAHRLAWCFFYGDFPENQIDHINGDAADNRILNLRDVTGLVNHKNVKLPKNNISGCVGVNYLANRGKWTSYIKSDGKQRSVYYGDNYKDAVHARKEAEIKHGYHPNHGRVMK